MRLWHIIIYTKNELYISVQSDRNLLFHIHYLWFRFEYIPPVKHDEQSDLCILTSLLKRKQRKIFYSHTHKKKNTTKSYKYLSLPEPNDHYYTYSLIEIIGINISTNILSKNLNRCPIHIFAVNNGSLFFHSSQYYTILLSYSHVPMEIVSKCQKPTFIYIEREHIAYLLYSYNMTWTNMVFSISHKYSTHI